MNNQRLLFAFLYASMATLLAGAADAHPGHDENQPTAMRTWTEPSGLFKLQASFVAVRGDQVQLRKDDGSLVSLSINQFSRDDRHWIDDRQAEIRNLNVGMPAAAPLLALVRDADSDANEPAIARAFAPFKASSAIDYRWDDRYLYVESRGMPDHRMMVGITAWQQQVPLPQRYTGANAWRIPLHPLPAKAPLSAKTNFFRGAIALAANGVPIFNPIKNDGRTDTLLAGELDEFGGHCGRADDYHYHIAPVHLQAIVGEGLPIACALDGYPIYGYQNPGDPEFAPLDGLNGHVDRSGHYHYHATKTYPYLNGGFYGEVVERDGQVDPQPRAFSVRPALSGLRGAEITGFERSPDGNLYVVEYEYLGADHTVRYAIENGRRVTFTFDDGSNGARVETYPLAQAQRPEPRGGGGSEPRGRPPAGKALDKSRALPKGKAARPNYSDGEEVRRPWIEIHATEMDTDEDGMLSKIEMLEEARIAFDAYDADHDARLVIADLVAGRPVRSSMGGFILQHAQELDRDGDGAITREELTSNAQRMFDKADGDGDGRVAVSSQVDASNSPPARQGPPPSPGELGATGVRPPNIVFILIDDMGWRDVGFAGNTYVETPNIDRLAREGVQFAQAYASGPNCAPTRACLLSGQYPPRHGVYTVVDSRHDPGQPHHRIISAISRESLDARVVTIAEALKTRGYATGCFGMWNLGRGRDGPTTATGQGFDIYKKPQDLGFEVNAYFDDRGRYLTDVLTQEGLRFIEQNRDRPFLLYLPTHAIHAPFDPKPELVEKYRAKARRLGDGTLDAVYAAMIEAVDDNVGRILGKLADLNLADDTLVVFTSDNGGTPQYVAPLKGSKGALYEGGIRVPCAVWWSRVKEPGLVSSEPILSMDFYPTLLEVAGAAAPADQAIDGVNLVPILTGLGSIDREAVFWHFPCYIGRGEPASAVRMGDWKLIELFEEKRFELYNLRNDPGETVNLARSNPTKAHQLREALSDWQHRTNAPKPSEPNPAFDPNQFRRGKRRPRDKA